jgi:hypothetical protein
MKPKIIIDSNLAWHNPIHLQITILAIKVIGLTMILHCNYADEGCGLPGDEGTIGKECGKVTETIAGNSSLSEGAIHGKGRMVISAMSKQHESDTIGTGSTRRRDGRWFRLNRSSEQKDMMVGLPRTCL